MRPPQSLPFFPPAVHRSSARLLFLLLLANVLAFAPLRAASVPSVTGTYENEGSIVETDSDYKGTVSLSGLLGLEFDLAQGLLRHAEVARVEIEQRDQSFVIRTKNARGEKAWTGRWERNGGYEPTKDGVKILIRPRSGGDDFFMFTLSPIKDGEVLLVEIQRVQASKFGPTGKPVGKFLFLRAVPAS
jgi:hypothetical protein